MRKKILVVDDSITVRQQLSLVLSSAGFDVLEAGDGIEGAETIDATPDLALVICDVNMPRMNEDKRHAAIPIVMLTTEGDPTLVARAKGIGAKGWIVKPFKPELLVAAARKLAV